MSTVPVKRSATLVLRGVWDRAVVYLPLVVMGLMAMTTYWLVRNTPHTDAPDLASAPRHVPDYFMRDFSLRVFDATGHLQRELYGREARHYPDTDTLEIDQVRIRSVHVSGRVSTAQAQRGITNADGSEMQLFDHAVVVREPVTGANGKAQPRMELRSEFLDFFADTEEIRTHLPVELLRGDGDRFTADRMRYDNLNRVMQLQGRVHGLIQAHARTQ
jgi:lipopolysaccharide export system protein LptC